MAIGLGCLYSAIEKTIIMLNTKTVQITWRIPMIDWKIRNRIHDVWPIHLLSSDANERWSTHQFNKWYICSWFKTCYMCTPIHHALLTHSHNTTTTLLLFDNFQTISMSNEMSIGVSHEFLWKCFHSGEKKTCIR